jgi:hypothetical protein
MRRQFSLPEADDEFLRNSAFNWETVIESNVMRLVINDFRVPSGYNHEEVALNLRIETSYPDGQIDMVYFFPDLARTDGKPISALAADTFDGKNWQRWSRHRTSANPWRPGIDNIETHLHLVNDWLKREFRRNP